MLVRPNGAYMCIVGILSGLVENPEDRFSHVATHLVVAKLDHFMEV